MNRVQNLLFLSFSQLLARIAAGTSSFARQSLLGNTFRMNSKTFTPKRCVHQEWLTLLSLSLAPFESLTIAIIVPLCIWNSYLRHNSVDPNTKMSTNIYFLIIIVSHLFFTFPHMDEGYYAAKCLLYLHFPTTTATTAIETTTATASVF